MTRRKGKKEEPFVNFIRSINLFILLQGTDFSMFLFFSFFFFFLGLVYIQISIRLYFYFVITRASTVPIHRYNMLIYKQDIQRG